MRYDLIAKISGVFIRLIKYVTPKDGSLYVNYRSSNHWSVLQYGLEEINVFAVYNPKDNEVY